jgi:molybdopterin-guanine dinucleotide biosynthesis protein B
MKILAFVGYSESGKTRLITRLVRKLKKRGLSVAVIKHCGHGFDFGGRAKDSSKFLAAGAEGVALVSEKQRAVVRREKHEKNFADLARSEFPTADIVLVEGGRGNKTLKKVEVLRQGISAGIKTPSRELAAVVGDYPVSGEVPVFRPESIAQIADWLEGGIEMEESSVVLKVDGKSIPMNPFVQKIFINTLSGMVRSLDRVKESPQEIRITIKNKA